MELKIAEISYWLCVCVPSNVASTNYLIRAYLFVKCEFWTQPDLSLSEGLRASHNMFMKSFLLLLLLMCVIYAYRPLSSPTTTFVRLNFEHKTNTEHTHHSTKFFIRSRKRENTEIDYSCIII